MGVISVRIPDELENELKRSRIKVPEVVRKALEREARDAMIKRKFETLEKYRLTSDKTSEEIIREIRDEH